METQRALPVQTDQKVFMQILQIGVKMLEARSHLWHYVKSLLLWICEIYFVQWGVKLPRPGCYLPVSYHAIQFSYLNFTPPPYFPSITPYNQAEAPLLPTVHRNPSSFSGWMFPSLALCFGWSRMFLGSNTRFCISSTVGSCEQRPLHNLISDSKSLRTECSNQTASSCFLHPLASCLCYSCLKSQRAMGMRVGLFPWLFRHTDLPWGLGQAPWLAAACSYISASRIMPRWK